jgi:hypothetical protein
LAAVLTAARTTHCTAAAQELAGHTINAQVRAALTLATLGAAFLAGVACLIATDRTVADVL